MGTLKGQRAQTAVELAVFGAILIFALGAIVRSGVNRGNQQNAVLKATRMALTLSYKTSEDLDNSSRNSASILLVEDRLTAGSGKYGPIDRSPMLISGSGMHSANVLMPVDFGDVDDLPLFDLYVNGRHVSLSTSAFKTVNLFEGGCPPGECLSQVWIDRPDPDENVNKAASPIRRGGDPNTTPRYVEKCTPCPEIEPNCMGLKKVGPCANAVPCPATCSSCASTSRETYTISTGVISPCAKLYSIVDHYPLIKEWCDESSSSCLVPCSESAVPGCNLSLDERFDLDRDGDWDVPVAQRGRFAWQWFRVMGFKESQPSPPKYNLKAPPGPVTFYGLLVGEGINEDPNLPQNLQVDVDQDLKMEIVKEIYHRGRKIVALNVIDDQEGDVNFGFDDRDLGMPPGFTKDVNIYTYVKGTGTYLRIDEGELYNGTQHIRTASKKDVVDLIERIFKLSNDTGRLCKNPFAPVEGRGIEACGNCNSPENLMRTCMDTETLLLFFRSRVSDYHGHKWITDLSNDPYVDFTR